MHVWASLLFYILPSFFPTVGEGSLSISPAPDPHQSLSFTPLPTDFPTPSDDVGPSNNPGDNAGSSDSASDNVGLIVAVMVGTLLLALAVVGIPLIVIVVIRMRRKGKRRKGKQRIHDVPPTDSSSSG